MFKGKQDNNYMLLKSFFGRSSKYFIIKKKTMQCLLEQKLVKCNNALKLKTQKQYVFGFSFGGSGLSMMRILTRPVICQAEKDTMLLLQ